jgi:hypothetical protein
LKYLETEYFSENSAFKKQNWNYYGKKFSETSTNSIEAINKKLKPACNYGKITFERACEILKTFKSDFRSEFEYKVLFSNLNPRKTKTLDNMKNRQKIADEYELLSYDEKSLFVLQYCYKFETFKPFSFYAVNPILDIFPILKTSIRKKNLSKMIQWIRHLIISKMSLKIFNMNLN